MNSQMELSVVLPCLNEADTVGDCVRKAMRGIRASGLQGEVVLADNGSRDGSPQLAEAAGARVVPVERRGYGSALMAGIKAAAGRFIIMGDADDSYDFEEIPKFAEKLKDGVELVQGCRLPAGGGQVLPGAMPFLHRWWGNPMFSLMSRFWFHAPIHDVYCGMRGFTKTLYERLDQKCTGMEFATEMIIKASLFGARMTEVPITLHPDGRKTHAPHLKTFRDGWRTLRLFLIYSPRWLFLVPGSLLILLGLIGYGITLLGVTFGGLNFDDHTLLTSSLFLLCGYQSLIFAIFTKTFASQAGLMPADPRIERFYKVATLERCLVLALVAITVACGLFLADSRGWHLAGLWSMDTSQHLRLAIPGATLMALAVQTVFSGFFASILGMNRQ